jgi:DNA-binding MarR family transcriptional regulator
LPPQAEDVLALARVFAGFGPSYFKWVQQCFAASGVSFARMKLLGALHHGSKKMNELSRELGVTARNVTTLVDALEKDKLVRRVPHATDRRATVIELTTDGATYARQMATGAPLKAIAELFLGLSAEERKQLSGLITKLHGLLTERGFGGPHPCVASEPPRE